MAAVKRCDWSTSDLLMVNYHDTEWGIPVHDDPKVFEFLTLDVFQAGLGWGIALKKREDIRRAFAGFDAEKIAGTPQGTSGGCWPTPGSCATASGSRPPSRTRDDS
ncbi:MAG: DNA-3-methyladenine glycosylase I [Armatimonadota bacterium]|nr:DNA-3-methyladenine glycosylase I [Armatimonadota bacterium]